MRQHGDCRNTAHTREKRGETFAEVSTRSQVVFLLTFGCYGGHLPGDERGSVERTRPGRGGYLEPSAALARFAQTVMKGAPYKLTSDRAAVVLGAIRQVCVYRGWDLMAAHVRTTHVHVVVDLPASPDRAIGDFKAYASRDLNKVEGPATDGLAQAVRSSC